MSFVSEGVYKVGVGLEADGIRTRIKVASGDCDGFPEEARKVFVEQLAREDGRVDGVAAGEEVANDREDLGG